MNKLKMGIALAAVAASSGVFAEQTFYNPTLTASNGVTGYIDATASAEFCERQNYTAAKDVQVTVTSSVWTVFPASLSNPKGAWTASYAQPPSVGAYLNQVTCYTPPPKERVVSNKITIFGRSVPMHKSAQLYGWELPTYVMRCRDLGYTPVSQKTEKLYSGYYAKYTVQDNAGWTLRYKENDGTAIDIVSELVCKG